MILHPLLHYSKLVSIISVRFERTEYNRAEFESLKIQGFSSSDLEIIIIDESKTANVRTIVEEYSNHLSIVYRNVSDQMDMGKIYRTPSGKASHSWHLNYALSLASGMIVIIETGEFTRLK